MMKRHSALLGFAFSVLALWWLWATTDASVLTNVLIRRPEWGYLSSFFLLAALILFCFAVRWRGLVGAKLAYPDAIVAALFCMGGNMILPARGGDLLRLHHTSVVSGIGMWRLAGSLMVEKLLDLALIIGVGVFSVAVIGKLAGKGSATFISGGLILFTATLFAFVLVKFPRQGIFAFFRILQRLAGRKFAINRSLVRWAFLFGRGLTRKMLLLPMFYSFGMWLGLYAVAYMLCAMFIGIQMSYSESLFIVCAGALGLALPGAPSGLGTFHASIVSGFLLLGRSGEDGLVFAVVVHGLFFFVYGLPALIAYMVWRLRQRKAMMA